MDRQASLLVGGLAFAEAPRWREGRLWFSNMHEECVKTVDLDGCVEVIVKAPDACRASRTARIEIARVDVPHAGLP